MVKDKSSSAPRKSTPGRRGAASKRSPSRATEARSVRSTRASSLASSLARRRSPSHSPPPLPNIDQASRLDNEALAQHWIDEEKATDPVFATPTITRRAEQLIGCAIQPSEHCQLPFFPTVARKFGLQRWLPQALPKKGSRGPTCTNDGATNKICHKGAIPAFLYTHPDAICSRAEYRGYPALICRWDVTPAGSLVPQACWSCCTHGDSACGLYALELFRIDIASPVDQPIDVERGRAVLPPSQHHAPDNSKSLSRTADQANFDPPGAPAKRRQPMPRLATDPVDIFSTGSASTELRLNFSRAASADRGWLHSNSAPADLRLAPSARPQSEGPHVPSNVHPPPPHIPPTASAPTSRITEPSSLRQWESYLTTFMPASMYQTSSHPPQPQTLPTRPAQPETELRSEVSPLIGSPSRPAPDTRDHERKTAAHGTRTPAATEKSSGSVTVKLAELRASIDQSRSSAVSAAQQYVDSCRALQMETNRVIDQAFHLFQEMCEEAERDRESLLAERLEHEKNIVTLRDYDSVLVASTTQMAEKDQIIQKLNGQVDFLEKHLEQSRRGQGAVEKRMAQAYTEKAQAESERDAALRERDEMRDTARRALNQMEEAVGIRKQAEAAITDAQVNISELRLVISDQSKTIEALRIQLPQQSDSNFAGRLNASSEANKGEKTDFEGTLSAPGPDIPGDTSQVNVAAGEPHSAEVLGATTAKGSTRSAIDDGIEVHPAEQELINQLSIEQLNELLQGSGEMTSPKPPAIQVVPPTGGRATSPAIVADYASQRSHSSRTTPTAEALSDKSPLSQTASLPGAYE